MNDCVFCKIIRREIPANIVYETENIIAFLDIYPLNKGHLLIVPKEHAAKLHEISNNETLKEILIVAKDLAKALKVENYNILQNNGRIAHQDIMHVHFHLIPKSETGEGLVIKWQSKSATSEELEEIKNEILNNLKKSL